MSNREGGMRDAQVGGPFSCAAVKDNGWPAARGTDDLDFKPCDTAADACTERLGGSLLRRESRRKALSSIALAQAVCLLGGRVDPIEEAAAIALPRRANALDFDHVNAAADDHLFQQATTLGPGGLGAEL